MIVFYLKMDYVNSDTTMEEWRAIKGYEGIYEVSSNGRVRAIERFVSGRRGMVRGHIVAAQKQKTGYMRICLSKDHKKTYFSVHRLVAEAFVSNPNNYPCVNHLDEDRANNKSSNLQWCTYAQNNNYGTRCSKISETQRCRGKSFMKIDNNNNIVAIYRTMAEAQELGFDRSGIWKCLTGKKYTYLGFKWEYC